jgi:sterol desaturase/sphingolipid hydroxylase (fatty acid hydroxylase superfamily)
MTVLRQDLEAPPGERGFGSGWISGVLALTLALLGLGAVLCMIFPEELTLSKARDTYAAYLWLIRLALHLVLIAGFVLGVVSIVLRKQKVLGFTALGAILVATALGGSGAQNQLTLHSDVYLGLDWFLLNLLFTGIVFIPVERFLGRRQQPIFRNEWREGLLYFLISSLFVQVLAYLSMAPALAILANTNWASFRNAVGSQPLVLQVLEIMLLTDLVQYWVHRAFHRFPFLWRFHAIHHSSQTMDWLASGRMHLAEIVILRGMTVIPMIILGYSEPAVYIYLIFVYFLSSFVHSNLRVPLGWVDRWIITPRYHHWHHGVEREAIDVNFAVHFPVLDMLFGTFYLPRDARWPAGYGINHAIPKGFLRQLLYPFVPSRLLIPEPATPAADAPVAESSGLKGRQQAAP